MPRRNVGSQASKRASNLIWPVVARVLTNWIPFPVLSSYLIICCHCSCSLFNFNDFAYVLVAQSVVLQNTPSDLPGWTQLPEPLPSLKGLSWHQAPVAICFDLLICLVSNTDLRQFQFSLHLTLEKISESCSIFRTMTLASAYQCSQVT